MKKNKIKVVIVCMLIIVLIIGLKNLFEEKRIETQGINSDFQGYEVKTTVHKVLEVKNLGKERYEVTIENEGKKEVIKFSGYNLNSEKPEDVKVLSNNYYKDNQHTYGYYYLNNN